MTIEVTAPRPTEGEILAYRLEQERAEQEIDIYNRLLEEANERGRSFAGHLNSLDAAGILEGPAGNRYDLFMKKYEQDMDYQKRFGDQLLEERRTGKTKNDEDMDPFVLEELMKQRQILNEIDKKHRRGIPSGEMQRLSKGGALRKITSSDNDPTMADFLATAAAGIVPGGLLVYGADRYGKRMDATEETPRPVSPQDQEFVNQRILELMMEEPVNEMRAVTPDMFERQKLGIERLLSNLYEPRRARDIAETISTAVDFSPAGIPTSIAEGIRMMGDDQPLMGAGMVALGISPFKGMPRGKLQGLFKKADEKLDNLRTRLYQAQSKMKDGLSKADYDEGFKESIKIQADINKTTAEMDEMMEALYPKLANRKGYHQLGNRVPEKLAKKFDIDPMSPTAVDDYIKSAKLESVPVPEKQLASYPGDRTTFYFDPSTGEAFKRIITAGADDKLVSYTNNKLLPKYVKEAMARKKLSGSKSILPEKEALERSDRFLNIKSDGRSYGFHKKGESTSWFIDPETNEVFKWYSGKGATPRGYHVRREVPDFVRKLQESSRKKLSAVPESGTKEPNFFQGLAEKNPRFKEMLIEGRKDAGYIKPVSSGKEFEDVQKELFDRIMNLELSEKVANNPKLRQMAVDLIKRSPTMSQKELDMFLKVLESPRMTPSQTRFLMQFDSLTRGNQPKQVKGIINATPETQKLYQELLDSPSAINTSRHNKVKKDASEQLREIKKQVEESDLEDRNEVLRLLAQLRDKKPK